MAVISRRDETAVPPASAVVVVGASAGGVEALRTFVGALPPALPAAVVVVLHIPADAPSALAAILHRAGPLRAVTAAHGSPLSAGTVFTAPADHHVVVADGHLHLSRGPRENGHRPAVDPLFRSAAVDFGSRAIGVVLSGNRDDGTAGLADLVRHGGRALVQDPEEAVYDGMPRSALQHVHGARAMPAVKLGAAVAELVAGSAVTPGDLSTTAPGTGRDQLTEVEARMAADEYENPYGTPALEDAEPSGLSCPDCDGVLFRLPGEPPPRFRCRVGHAWSPVSLAAQQDVNIEAALWSATRALAEKAELHQRLGVSAAAAGRHEVAADHRYRAEQAEGEAAVLRRMLAHGVGGEEGGEGVG